MTTEKQTEIQVLKTQIRDMERRLQELQDENYIIPTIMKQHGFRETPKRDWEGTGYYIYSDSWTKSVGKEIDLVIEFDNNGRNTFTFFSCGKDKQVVEIEEYLSYEELENITDYLKNIQYPRRYRISTSHDVYAVGTPEVNELLDSIDDPYSLKWEITRPNEHSSLQS